MPHVQVGEDGKVDYAPEGERERLLGDLEEEMGGEGEGEGRE